MCVLQLSVGISWSAVCYCVVYLCVCMGVVYLCGYILVCGVLLCGVSLSVCSVSLCVCMYGCGISYCQSLSVC